MLKTLTKTVLLAGLFSFHFLTQAQSIWDKDLGGLQNLLFVNQPQAHLRQFPAIAPSGNSSWTMGFIQFHGLNYKGLFHEYHFSTKALDWGVSSQLMQAPFFLNPSLRFSATKKIFPQGRLALQNGIDLILLEGQKTSLKGVHGLAYYHQLDPSIGMGAQVLFSQTEWFTMVLISYQWDQSEWVLQWDCIHQNLLFGVDLKWSTHAGIRASINPQKSLLQTAIYWHRKCTWIIGIHIGHPMGMSEYMAWQKVQKR